MFWTSKCCFCQTNIDDYKHEWYHDEDGRCWHIGCWEFMNGIVPEPILSRFEILDFGEKVIG